MMTLPAWASIALDILIFLTIFICITVGTRRGLVEHAVTTCLLILALFVSIGISLSSSYLPQFPYKTLFFFVFPGLMYFIVLLGSRQLMSKQLQQLEKRNVPLWDALLGALLGGCRGIAVVVLLGVVLITPSKLLKLHDPAFTPPLTWTLLTPLSAPLFKESELYLLNTLRQSQLAQSEARGLSKLIGDLLGEEFLAQLLGDKQENTLERKQKQLQKNKAAADILGNEQQ